MKTEMKDTSEEAFKGIRNDKLKTAIQCYEAIKKLGVCSNKQIQAVTHLAINQVSGRVNDLRNKYKVVGLHKKDLCPITNHLVCMWKVVKDWDREEYKNSSIFNNVVNHCYKCGCLNCECVKDE